MNHASALGFRPARRGALRLVEDRLVQSLAVRVLAAGVDGQAAVGVASVLHGEGSTTIAASLAACVAASLGRRVVLIDANLRSPGLAAAFGLEPGPGLADVLSGAAALEDVLRLPAAGADRAGRLLVLPAGESAGTPSVAVAGPGMPALIAALHGYAELLVFDGAPLLAYPDTTLLAPHLDGVVVVVQAERSTEEQGRQAAQSLRDGGGHMLGAVLNRVRSHIPRALDRLL